MEVKNKNEGKKGVFYIEHNNKEIGIMDYVLPHPDKMVINHTEVDEAYEGKGLGKQLVLAGVSYAREHGMKISPLCPFAKKIFDDTPDLADILVK